jgi:hypothetical protein
MMASANWLGIVINQLRTSRSERMKFLRPAASGRSCAA